MNTGLTPAGLPAYFAYASCHSVSNHPPVMARLFFGSLVLSAHAHGSVGLLHPGRSTSQSGKRGLRGGLRTALAGSSHRLAESSSRWSSYDDALLRTGSSPPAALHPVSPRRSSLRSQAVIPRPDGDFHPAV